MARHARYARKQQAAMERNITNAARIWSACTRLTASVENITTGRASSVTRRLKTGWWESLKTPCLFKTWMKMTRRKS